jgi:hypothetical protein
MDNTYNKTSGDIIAVLSLSMYQQTLRNKSVEELRYIARHAFNIDNAVEMTKARAKMLEPKKKKRIRSAEEKESVRRIEVKKMEKVRMNNGIKYTIEKMSHKRK